MRRRREDGWEWRIVLKLGKQMLKRFNKRSGTKRNNMNENNILHNSVTRGRFNS